MLLFDITFFILLSKSVSFTKLAISLLFAKCACANLGGNFSAVKLLTGVVI